MGFFQPEPPPFEIEEWQKRPYLERLRPLVQDWGERGFGTPHFVFFLYLFKIAVYAVGGLLVISATTPGLGGLGSLTDWWTEPIVFQKAAAWTMLWEVLGLGAGSLPLTLRFSPMIGGVLYWLRPGTIRQPPWPELVPRTRGSRRTLLDVALYGGLLAALVNLVVNGETAVAGTVAGRLDPAAVAATLGLLGLLGLRDKVSFLAARPEIYGNLMLIFLFPLTNLLIAAQLVFFCIWWGAAASKLNRHFPFVVTVMISNTPWNRWRAAKRRLYKQHPDDMRPSTLGSLTAHLGTVLEFTLPVVLILSSGGTIGMIAVAGMVIFHLHILSTFPLAVPLEWNVFMIFGLLFLFGHYGDVPFSTLEDPLLLVILGVTCVGIPVLGNFRPDLVSFLPSMRYYAGNWATSQWLFRRDVRAEERLDTCINKPAPIVGRQLEKFYDDPGLIDVLLHKGLAFRSMHSHGRALATLAMRSVEDIDEYSVREGELIAGVVCGYNFGDGHFHNDQLLAAVQKRCLYDPGDLRVVTLEAQPAGSPYQHYRIFDAAEGLIEEGRVRVADMVSRQPWLGEDGPVPVDPEYVAADPMAPAGTRDAR